MSKSYVLNPKTNRLVSADGCTGVKIINELLTKKIQVKYQSTKEKQPVVKKETPKKKPTPKKTPKETPKKKPTPKKTPKEPPKKTPKETLNKTPTKKPTVVKQQNNQIGIFQKYDKIVEEIKSVYTSLENRLFFYQFTENTYGFTPDYPDEVYITLKDLKKKMPVFLKFSGLSDKRIKQIIKSCEDLFNMSQLDNFVVFFEYVLNSILVGEPTLNLKPLRVFLGLYDPNIQEKYDESNLDMKKIKPLTESRLLNYNTALRTTQRDNAWENHPQYFKL